MDLKKSFTVIFTFLLYVSVASATDYNSCTQLGKQYNVITDMCVDTCSSPQILYTEDDTCINQADCINDKKYDSVNNVCFKDVTCNSDEIFYSETRLCIPIARCNKNENLFIDSNRQMCVPLKVCTAPQVLVTSTNTCETKADCDPTNSTWNENDNTCLVSIDCGANSWYDPSAVDLSTGNNGCVTIDCGSNLVFNTTLKACVSTDPICDTANNYHADTQTGFCVLDPIQPNPLLAIAVDVPDSYYQLTVGFNPLSTNHERLYDPIDGRISDWTVAYQLAGKTFSGFKCDQSSNEITEDGYIINTADYYINKNNGCDVPDGYDYSREDLRSVPSSDVLNYNLLWLDLGLSPDPLGTTETIKCSFGGNCVEDQSSLIPKPQATIDLFKNEYPLSLATFSPTPGSRPILSGSNTAFLYGYQNLNYSNRIGIPGLGGGADLPTVSASQKYCYKKRDATTEPGLAKSFYAEHPQLNFLKINWKPFNENPTASDGDPGTLKNGKTAIIKGLDSSVRFWLGNDNVLNKR